MQLTGAMKRHWEWATEPNDREKASFLKENILPIQESGQLKFIEAMINRRCEMMACHIDTTTICTFHKKHCHYFCRMAIQML